MLNVSITTPARAQERETGSSLLSLVSHGDIISYERVYPLINIQSRLSHHQGASPPILRRLRSTPAYHNSGGASLAPTLGYLSPLPLPPPIPERATRTMRLQRTVKKRIRNISLLGVLRDLSRTRVFRLFQSIYTDPYSSAWRPVTTKLPVRENFLLEAGVTMCSKCLSCPLDRPEQSRTSVLICTARTLRVLGVSRLDNGSIYLTQPFYAGVTFCPRSEGRALKCHHPHGHVPRWLFRSCRLSAVSLLPSWAQMNASCPKASLSP